MRRLGLLDEAAVGPFVKHGCGALVDAFVEERAGWVEAEAQDAIAGEGVAALLPLFGHGSALDCVEALAGCERDLDGAYDFGDVVGVDRRCSGAGRGG